MVLGMHILSTKSFLLFLVSAFGVSLFGNSNFSRQTIDLGMVVSDIEKSVSFYKQVVGFEDESATKLKMMQVDSKKPARTINQPHIHTLTGFSYLTIFVEDVDLVMTNAKKHGHEAYAKSPQILPKGFPQDLCLLMLKDPDGNFVEIVGPNTKALKKKKSKK
jgi:lactoylglutathione lyase